MAEYISTFTTGFHNVIESAIVRYLGEKVVIKQVFDGLVHYSFDGSLKALQSVPFFNNTFLLINSFTKKQLNFNTMVFATKIKQPNLIVNRGTFRVRFSNMNRFEGVPKKLSKHVEQEICLHSKMRVNRVNPKTEFWYIIRSEGVGFFGQLLFKRVSTEKNLRKGELRPEFAFLLCCLGNPTSSDTVCDPFAGYGSIPKQIIKHFQYKKLYVIDNDIEIVQSLKNMFSTIPFVFVFGSDARQLELIYDGSIDIIITDPPWGIFDEVGDITDFYYHMLIEMNRLLSDDGKVVLVTAKKAEFEFAVQKTSFFIKDYIDTLVNGKKARVYILSK